MRSRWSLRLRTVVVASAVAAAVGGAPAYAASGATGTLTFEPASGADSVPLTAVSTGICSDPRGTNLQLRVSGAGFPPDTNVTPNLKASIYPVDLSTGGYDVPLQNTLQAFAAQQNPAARLAGRYDFTLLCKKSLGRAVYQTYVGSLVFSSPRHFEAVVPRAAAASTPAPPVTTKPAQATPVPVKPTSATSTPTRPTPAISTSRPTPAARPSSTTRPPQTRIPTAGAAPPARTSAAVATVPSPATTTSVAAVVPSSALATTAAAAPAAALPAPSPGRPSRGVTAEAATFTAIVVVVVVLLGLVLRRRVQRWRAP